MAFVWARRFRRRSLRRRRHRRQHLVGGGMGRSARRNRSVLSRVGGLVTMGRIVRGFVCPSRGNGIGFIANCEGLRSRRLASTLVYVEFF